MFTNTLLPNYTTITKVNTKIYIIVSIFFFFFVNESKNLILMNVCILTPS